MWTLISLFTIIFYYCKIISKELQLFWLIRPKSVATKVGLKIEIGRKMTIDYALIVTAFCL